MPATYSQRLSQSREINEKRRKDGRDIKAGFPEVVDRIRRRDCLADFELFCKTYHAAEFNKPWADYHKTTAAKIQAAVEVGGWYARALPRGGGKTTLCCCGIEWASLRGSHKYPIIIGASETLGTRLLRGIKTQLQTNELLLADFPHAIWPIWRLENESRKAKQQTYGGEFTRIEWGDNRVVLPWIEHEDSLANGVVLEAFGITSAFRGLKHTLPNGETVRPDLGLVDDPQTRESAKSPSQTQGRLETLTGDFAYLAGPGKPMPVFCTATVIYEGDLADQILDRDKHPEWQGERTKMVEEFPTNLELWDQYGDILRQSLLESGDISAATEFYAEHREEMDAGSRVSWEERHREDELSAIQHAMNLKIRDEAAFYAECQNEPVVAQDDLSLLSADEICKKVSGYKRRQVPDACSLITAFTDVQKEHLFWMVCAWTPDFTGYVIDYGAWPEQGRNYFTRRDVRKKLSTTYAGDESGTMYAALTELGNKLAGEPYTTTSGRELELAKWCIDANWRDREPAVKSYTAQSEHRGILNLTYGRGVKASQNPFSQAQRAIKWKTGPGWFWLDGPGAGRGVMFDANLWKKRVHDALTLSAESRGSLQLFKANPQVHRMLADHLLAERPVKTEANGRTVYEWIEIPGRDNEGLDCLVGCMLAASIAGLKKDTERTAKPKKQRLTLAEMSKHG